MIIAFIFSFSLCFLAFSKKANRRKMGRAAMFIFFLLAYFLTWYCLKLAFFLPNTGSSGVGNGIYAFIAIIPFGFAWFLGGMCYQSYKAEKNYWSKTQEERDAIDNQNR